MGKRKFADELTDAVRKVKRQRKHSKYGKLIAEVKERCKHLATQGEQHYSFKHERDEKLEKKLRKLGLMVSFYLGSEGCPCGSSMSYGCVCTDTQLASIPTVNFYDLTWGQ